MDAHALLSSQGWRGHGHSLHKTSDSIGLSKPLLLNRKDNTKGLGTSSHFNADQWWLNAFDEQLKGLETSKKGQVKQMITTGKLNTVDVGGLGKYSVYNSFVKGGFLNGTVDLLKKQAEDSTGGDSHMKKKETKEERRQRKEEKRQRKEQRAVRREARHAQRAVRKEARRRMREIRRQAQQEKRAAKIDKRKKEASLDKSSEESSGDVIEDEKRLRRAKKGAKRRKRATEN
ncbi:uncharacterized protein J7T54_000581 [Emericellopsis cladophorae]|uniref:G-patch domain-containing protein n=1 Tax=Emericellopsis cladophorae TaxID=2686198 RepID=A0A9Q0BG85_9HYPO|nr:uncharacterized protein J7T54_000581 [Emericellopsis cladophorae]KAI6783079.1 hypothetical protein J7T54_000581 [Emericellopsis cladophorae]